MKKVVVLDEKQAKALEALVDFALDIERERNGKGREEPVFSDEDLDLAAKASEALGKRRLAGSEQQVRAVKQRIFRACHIVAAQRLDLSGLRNEDLNGLVLVFQNIEGQIQSLKNRLRRGF